MACTGCKGVPAQKRSCDECVQRIALALAKETGHAVGLYRDDDGKLRISGPGDSATSYITAHLQDL